MANFIDLIGRIFISSVFLLSGYNKIFSHENTVTGMEGYGVPGFSITTAIIFHLDFSNQMQIVAFLKNLGLAGGFLFISINGPKDFAVERKKKFVRL